MHRNLAGSVTCLLLLACSTPSGDVPELPEPFTHATAMRDCAPWDGPAVSIILTTAPLDSTMTPTEPWIHLSIWRDSAVLANGLHEWPSDEQVGAASECPTADSCEAAETGRVRFREFEGDTLVGQFRLTFRNDDPIEGGFRAVWLERRMMCG
jgi:hypothetical protein